MVWYEDSFFSGFVDCFLYENLYHVLVLNEDFFSSWSWRLFVFTKICTVCYRDLFVFTKIRMVCYEDFLDIDGV